MRIKWGQDVATAALFIVIGVGALIVGWDYPRGTTQRPGTGVLPAILAWCLVGTGGLLIIKSIFSGDVVMAKWAWRPFLLVTLACVSFGLVIDELGLVVTTLIALTLCALGTPETRWREFLIFLAIMIAIGYGLFIWLLGMPIPTWPTKVPSFLNFILK